MQDPQREAACPGAHGRPCHVRGADLDSLVGPGMVMVTLKTRCHPSPSGPRNTLGVGWCSRCSGYASDKDFCSDGAYSLSEGQ